MEKKLTKDDLVAAREAVTDLDAKMAYAASVNQNGLSQLAMVDIELETLDLTTRRERAMKDYQHLLVCYYRQEKDAVAQAQPSALEQADRFEGKGKI